MFSAVLISAILVLFPVKKAEASIFSDILKFFSGSGSGSSRADYEDGRAATISMPLLGSNTSSQTGIGGPETNPTPLAVTQDNALIALRNPAGTLPNLNQGNIFVYKVQSGDTPTEIANQFGITLSTLLWANSIKNSNLIKVGDELVILPVSGVQYKVEKGDTIISIAQKFKGDVSEILSFNGFAIDEPLEIGTAVIIPDGEMLLPLSTNQPSSKFSRLPELKGFFMRPIIGGRRSRGLHGFNGVDLAAPCGEPVLASAEGSVIIARSSGRNGGYGRYVVVSHSNGTQTLYAHLSSVLTSVAQSLTQGSLVGLIGSSGNSTGCHVHFEIRGARNPF